MKKREKRDSKKRRSGWDILIPIAAGMILVLCLGKLGVTYWGYHREAAANQKIEQTYVTEKPQRSGKGEAEPEQTAPYPALQVDFAALQEKNEDIVGWFYWELFDLSYPVVQGVDNEEYLHKSFEGEYAKSGTLFLDSGNAADLSSRYTIIYGHDMKDRSMFGKLKSLLQDTDVEENPYFYLFTESEIRKYRVFAYAVIEPEDALYNGVNSDEEYDAQMKRAKSLSVYQLPEKELSELEERPSLVSLSTCYQHSRRLLIQGYLQESFPVEK